MQIDLELKQKKQIEVKANNLNLTGWNVYVGVGMLKKRGEERKKNKKKGERDGEKRRRGERGIEMLEMFSCREEHFDRMRFPLIAEVCMHMQYI